MKWFLFLLIVLLLIVHQDLWNWAKAGPLWFGFLPIGLWYQALYTVACAVLLAMLVKWAWPAHLEASEPERRA